jgi:hypothetical protein
MSVPYLSRCYRRDSRFSSPGRWYATSVSLPLLGWGFASRTQLEQTSERLRLLFWADRKLLVVTSSHADVLSRGSLRH